MRRPSTRALVVAGLVVALLLAGVASYYASSAPDGLNRVAEDHGITRTERDHAAADGAMAGYRARGIETDRLSGLVAGVSGALVVLALFGGLTLVLRRRKEADAAEADADARAGDRSEV
jgi:cobalt/nickel transport system permease protein/cobalt/nickel transport protein